MQGDIREDDNDLLIPFTSIFFTQDKRDPDPWGHLLRAGRHFYDPIYDRAFAYPTCDDYGCVRSPVWAMGTQHPLSPPGDAEDTARRNHFSWVDARNNYWKALTQERYPNGGTLVDRVSSSVERQQRWVTTIASLGHVIHLLQDGAQPQHTRNDSHAPPWVSAGHNAPNGAAYEAFTDFRVTGNASGYFNNPIREMNDNLPSLSQLPPLVFDGYPIPTFSQPVKFFTTRYDNPGSGNGAINARRGMADFSNRNFFTAGTYPGFRECVPPGTSPCSRQPGPTYPLPENDITDTSVYTAIQVPGDVIVNGQTVMTTMYTRHVVDSVNPSYADRLPAQFAGKVPVVSKSSFAFFTGGLPDIQTNLRFENFIYDADVLLPRAVAYSAGMINFFFRGQLTVTSPPGGLFGVLDQGTPHTVDADGYPRKTDNTIFGFTTVRARVKNTSADIHESGSGTVVAQTAKTGKVVAIARYHRNPCYHPDLSGEYVQKPDGSLTVPAGCSVAQTRSAYQEISVSAPITIDANGNFPGTNDGSNACGNVGNLTTGPTGACANATGVLGEFDFSADPIPANATDLFLQLAYRGGLGQETDGIAVGTIDILEPNYYTVWNNSDWFGYQSQWTLPANVPSSHNPAATPITATDYCWQDQLIFGFAAQNVVGPAQFYRIGILADLVPHRAGDVTDFDSQSFGALSSAFVGPVRQSDKENGGTFTAQPMVYARGTTLGTIGWATYYKFWPSDTATTIDLLNLQPTIGNPGAPGRPVTGITQYTSLPQAPCNALPQAASPPGTITAGTRGGARPSQ